MTEGTHANRTNAVIGGHNVRLDTQVRASNREIDTTMPRHELQQQDPREPFPDEDWPGDEPDMPVTTPHPELDNRVLQPDECPECGEFGDHTCPARD